MTNLSRISFSLSVIFMVMFISCSQGKQESGEPGPAKNGAKSNSEAAVQTSEVGGLNFRSISNPGCLFELSYPTDWDNFFKLKTNTLISTSPPNKDNSLSSVLKVDARLGSQKFDTKTGAMKVSLPRYRDEARRYLETLKKTTDDLVIKDSGAKQLGGKDARYLLVQFKRKDDGKLVESRSLVGANEIASYIMSYSYDPALLTEDDETVWKKAVDDFKFQLPNL